MQLSGGGGGGGGRGAVRNKVIGTEKNPPFRHCLIWEICFFLGCTDVTVFSVRDGVSP